MNRSRKHDRLLDVKILLYQRVFYRRFISARQHNCILCSARYMLSPVRLFIRLSVRIIQQESRAAARKPRDAASVLFR